MELKLLPLYVLGLLLAISAYDHVRQFYLWLLQDQLPSEPCDDPYKDLFSPQIKNHWEVVEPVDPFESAGARQAREAKAEALARVVDEMHRIERRM